MIMGAPWGKIISLGIVPLTKWLIKYIAERRDKRKEELAKQLEEAEKARLKAQRIKATKDAKESYKDIDPSKYEV